MMTAWLATLVSLLLTIATSDTALYARNPATVAGGGPTAVRVLDAGFAVERRPVCPGPSVPPRRVVVALRVENPNERWAAEGFAIQVRLLAADRSPLVETDVPVAQLLPAERRNLVAYVDFEGDPPRGATIEAAAGEPSGWWRVEGVPVPSVTLIGGLRLRSFLRLPTFVQGLSAIVADCRPSPSGLVTGVTVPLAVATIANPLDQAFGELEVAAGAFDHQGRIISGGKKTVAVDPLGTVSVQVQLAVVSSFGEIARLEVTAAYPWLDLASYER
jgi:hypothetical protein